jgi:hypothetical protein
MSGKKPKGGAKLVLNIVEEIKLITDLEIQEKIQDSFLNL